MASSRATDSCNAGDGVPQPIVTLNRTMLLIGTLGGLVLKQPLITTVLFLIVLGAALFGRRGSLILRIGSAFMAERNRRAVAEGRVEERRVMRFNNAVA